VPELSGSLHSFGLLPVLRLLAESATTGRVHLTQDGWSGEVFIDAGQVVAATFGLGHGLGGSPSGILHGLTALEAIVLVMPNATFFFAEGVRSPDRNVEPAADELHARLTTLREEFLRSEPQVVSPMAVPLRVDLASVPLENGEIRIDRAKLRLLLAVDGQRTVAELIEGKGLLPTWRDLTWLASRGLIQLPH